MLGCFRQQIEQAQTDSDLDARALPRKYVVAHVAHNLIESIRQLNKDDLKVLFP